MNSDEIKVFLKQLLKTFKTKVLIPVIIFAIIIIFLVGVAYIEMKDEILKGSGAADKFNDSITMDMTNGRYCF